MLPKESEKEQVLRRSVTGFFTKKHANEFDKFPEVPFSEFKKACYEFCQENEYIVLELNEPNITPNFHSILIEANREKILILCNAIYPLVTFSNPMNHYSQVLEFLDIPEFREFFETMGFQMCSSHELTRKANSEDLARLDPCEIEQIKYWKPLTVGEIVFNWFD